MYTLSSYFAQTFGVLSEFFEINSASMFHELAGMQQRLQSMELAPDPVSINKAPVIRKKFFSLIDSEIGQMIDRKMEPLKEVIKKQGMM